METESRGVRVLAALAKIMLVVGVAFALLTLGQAVTGKGRDEIAVHHQVSGTHLKNLPAHVDRPPEVAVTSRITHATRHQKWLAAARDLPSVLFFLALLFLTRSILLSVRDGDPFTERNVARLRAIGFLFFIGLPLVTIGNSAVNSELAHTLDGALMTTTDISGTGPLISLGVFALAELFAQGVRLRQDVEGTV